MHSVGPGACSFAIQFLHMLPNCVCQLPATLQQIKNHIFHSILELVSNEIVKHEEYLTVSLLTKINIMINMKLELSMKHKKKKIGNSENKNNPNFKTRNVFLI